MKTNKIKISKPEFKKMIQSGIIKEKNEFGKIVFEYPLIRSVFKAVKNNDNVELVFEGFN